jgi:hypothetical protein
MQGVRIDPANCRENMVCTSGANYNTNYRDSGVTQKAGTRFLVAFAHNRKRSCILWRPFFFVPATRPRGGRRGRRYRGCGTNVLAINRGAKTSTLRQRCLPDETTSPVMKVEIPIMHQIIRCITSPHVFFCQTLVLACTAQTDNEPI